jgi:hypothetical protein
LNPFAGTEKENMWKDTPHKERNMPPRVTFDENDNSESIETSSINVPVSNKIVINISLDKNDGQGNLAGSKRNFYRGGNTGDYDDVEVIKPKRSKH